MNNWTYDEIKDSVYEYLILRNLISNNQKVIKSEIYKRLSSKYGRSPKSIGYRFSNISYVMKITGREWIKGLNPLENVGSNIIIDIENAILEIEKENITGGINTLKSKDLMIPMGNITPHKSEVTTYEYKRSQGVVDWVKLQSNGKCESCLSDAPFQDINGLPYLEVHHVKTLAEGGSDTITNAVALCPNCHREFHFGKNAIDKKLSLYSKIKRLIIE